jgi:hypothetical protein
MTNQTRTKTIPLCEWEEYEKDRERWQWLVTWFKGSTRWTSRDITYENGRFYLIEEKLGEGMRAISSAVSFPEAIDKAREQG